MIFGVTCPGCNLHVQDETIRVYVNLVLADHVCALRCTCGTEITQDWIATCTLAVTRKMIQASKNPKD